METILSILLSILLSMFLYSLISILLSMLLSILLSMLLSMPLSMLLSMLLSMVLRCHREMLFRFTKYKSVHKRKLVHARHTGKSMFRCTFTISIVLFI